MCCIGTSYVLYAGIRCLSALSQLVNLDVLDLSKNVGSRWRCKVFMGDVSEFLVHPRTAAPFCLPCLRATPPLSHPFIFLPPSLFVSPRPCTHSLAYLLRSITPIHLSDPSPPFEFALVSSCTPSIILVSIRYSPISFPFAQPSVLLLSLHFQLTVSDLDSTFHS